MTNDGQLWGLARRVRDGRKLAAVTVIGAVVLTLWLALSSDITHVVMSPTVELTPTPTIESALLRPSKPVPKLHSPYDSG